MIKNLSAALTVLVRAEARENYMHADVAAFGAPSECHTLVSRGEALRIRRARKHAESLAQAPLRAIIRAAKHRGGFTPCSGDPKWQAIVGRYYSKTYPY